MLLVLFGLVLYLATKNGAMLRRISQDTLDSSDIDSRVFMHMPSEHLSVSWKKGESAFSQQQPQGGRANTSLVPERAFVGSLAPPIRNCSTYDGVLLITHLGVYEGTGTLFFNLLVDQLIYAEMYNLQPVILPDNASAPCYDPNIHNQLETMDFAGTGEAASIIGSGSLACQLVVRGRKQVVAYPGPPEWNQQKHAPSVVTGNNLWTTYFKSLYGDSSICRELSVVNLQSFLEVPGLHKCSPFGVRSWPFHGLPSALLPNTTLKNWFYPMRRRAADIVGKYFHLKPSIETLVAKANPVQNRKCLALHIRATDKGNGRQKVPLRKFRRFMKEYDGDVFLATDDATVVTTFSQWMKDGQKLWYQEDAFRSTSSQPTFTLMKNNTHRTNVESLVDIYAMARCSYFLHGFSAMAEAVMYLNLDLHNKSVNLDDPGHMGVKRFGAMIRSHEA